MKKIECIIMDWAGTAVDYGCFAPVAAFIEAFAEKGLVGKVQFLGDLLDGHVGGLQQGFGLQNHAVVDPLSGGAPGSFLYHLREVFRRQAQFVGVIGHIAVFPKRVLHLSDEQFGQLIFPSF